MLRKSWGAWRHSLRFLFFVKLSSVYYSEWFLICNVHFMLQIQANSGRYCFLWEGKVHILTADKLFCKRKKKKKKHYLQGKNVPGMEKQSKIYLILYKEYVCAAGCLCSFSFPTYCLKQVRRKACLFFFCIRKKAVVGTVVNLLGKTRSTEHIFANYCRWS